MSYWHTYYAPKPRYTQVLRRAKRYAKEVKRLKEEERSANQGVLGTSFDFKKKPLTFCNLCGAKLKLENLPRHQLVLR
jgi:hypothetical protein